MVHLAEPTRKQPHEFDLQQRRLERTSENRKLDKLKVKLQMKVREQQQMSLISKAS